MSIIPMEHEMSTVILPISFLYQLSVLFYYIPYNFKFSNLLSTLFSDPWCLNTMFPQGISISESSIISLPSKSNNQSYIAFYLSKVFNFFVPPTGTRAHFMSVITMENEMPTLIFPIFNVTPTICFMIFLIISIFQIYCPPW